MWHLQTTDWLVFIFVSYMGRGVAWLQKHRRMDGTGRKTPTYTFGNTSCFSLGAGVGVGCVLSCPASQQAPKYQISVPL